MAHNIWGERAAFRNGPAWHGLGRSLDGTDGRATTALRVAELDFPVITVPMTFEWEGRMVESERVAILRPPTGDERGPIWLGDASRKFRPITNREVCQLLDPLTEEWPCETIGALGRGEQLFVTLKAGMTDVAGDEVAQYFFVWNSHDGTGALKIMFTPVRVVCQNTCRLGEQAATVSANVIHTERVYQEAEFAMKLVPAIRLAQLRGVETLRHFAKIRLDGDQVSRVLAATYPTPRVGGRAQLYDRLVGVTELGEDGSELTHLTDAELLRLSDARVALERAREQSGTLRVEALKRLKQFHQERTAYAWTAWAVYNAVTELECWREGGTNTTIGRSILVGPRGAAINRAFEALKQETGADAALAGLVASA